jgi:hypothetical protein
MLLAVPANIKTVYSWLKRSEADRNLNAERFPLKIDERTTKVSQSLDGIFCLGLGSIIFDVFPLSVVSDERRAASPDAKCTVFANADGNLLWLFLLITQAVSGTTAQWADFVPYLSRVQMPGRFLP